MNDDNQTTEEVTETEAPTIEQQVDQMVNERLAKVKENLDKAYAERDTLMKELESAKKAKTDVEIQALEQQGKATEALEMRLKQQEEQMAKLMQQNTQLSRDTQVKDALAGMDFASDKAARLASTDLTSSLVRGEDGNWRGPNGESINELASTYQKDEANSFMFKPRLSQGSASMQGTVNTANPDPKSTKPLSEMSTQEALQAAAEGRLGADKNWI